jgi:hypothetical protein
MSASTFDGTPFERDPSDVRFRDVLVNKLRKAWRKVKQATKKAVHGVAVGTKAVGNAGVWTVFQVTKVPHYLGLAAEIAGKVLVGVINAVLIAAAVILVFAVVFVWAVVDFIFWVVMLVLGLISTILSTPYHALVGGRDAVKGSWYGLWMMTTRPFRSVRTGVRVGYRELKNLFNKVDVDEGRLTLDEAWDEAYGYADLRPIDTRMPGKKDRPTPKRPPQHRSETRDVWNRVTQEPAPETPEPGPEAGPAPA